MYFCLSKVHNLSCTAVTPRNCNKTMQKSLFKRIFSQHDFISPALSCPTQNIFHLIMDLKVPHSNRTIRSLVTWVVGVVSVSSVSDIIIGSVPFGCTEPKTNRMDFPNKEFPDRQQTQTSNMWYILCKVSFKVNK